jgi:hypothetical protein
MPNEIKSSRHSTKRVHPSDDQAKKTRLANATLRYLQVLANHVVASLAKKPRN